MNINPKIIDHTNLKLDATEKDIEKLCNEAKKYGFGAVCIRPNYVTLAKNLLKNTPVKICTVIGFHTGLHPTEKKIEEAERAIKNGADELDMVININTLKSNDFDYVKNDISSVRKVAKDKILKVIIEVGVLTNNQKRKACHLVEEAGGDFVKTSTGFVKDKKGNKLGATIEDVKLIKSVVGDRLEIKAAGGISTSIFAQKLIEAGATRIGASASIAIVSNQGKKENLTTEQQLEYAWKWFEFHADQRLRAFYYYLIIIGALAFGYLSVKQGSEQVQKITPLLCGFGIIVSFAFMCLEIRNHELVNIGRFVLVKLGLEVSENDANKKYTEALEKIIRFKTFLKLKVLFKHGFWLSYIYILTGLISTYLILDYFISCNYLNWKSLVPGLCIILSLILSLLFFRRKN